MWYNLFMRTVNISDLKARLSAHIQLVRDGEEVLVCDRNKPVARIVPCRLEDHSEHRAAAGCPWRLGAAVEETAFVSFVAGTAGEHF